MVAMSVIVGRHSNPFCPKGGVMRSGAVFAIIGRYCRRWVCVTLCGGVMIARREREIVGVDAMVMGGLSRFVQHQHCPIASFLQTEGMESAVVQQGGVAMECRVPTFMAVHRQ